MSAIVGAGSGASDSAWWANFLRQHNVKTIDASNTNTQSTYQLPTPQELMERSIRGENSPSINRTQEDFYYAHSYTFQDAKEAKRFLEECKQLSAMSGSGITWVDSESDEYFGTDFFWEGIANEINHAWEPYSQPNTSYGEEVYSNLGDAVESLASRYATIRTRLEGMFSGSELDDQMKKLQSTFDKAVQGLGDQAESYLGWTLGNGEKFRSSTIDAFWNRASQYHQFIQKNPDYSNLKGEDAEFKKDTRLMATLLREQYRGEGISGGKSSGSYSLQALRAASDLAKAWDGASPYLGCGINGASYGLNMGYQSVLADQILQKYGVQDELGSFVTDKLVQDFEKAMDEAERSANAIRIPQDRISIDREAANAMLKQFIHAWSKSGGDMRETLLKSGTILVTGKQPSQLSHFDRNFLSSNPIYPFERYQSQTYMDKLEEHWQWVSSGLPS